MRDWPRTSPLKFMEISLRDGERGAIFDDANDNRYALIRLHNGRVLRVERSLVEQRGQELFLPLSAADLEDRRPTESSVEGRDEMVIPVIGEDLQVVPEKREVGAVRVHKTVQEHEELIDEPVFKERVDVKRVAINQVVDGMLPVRQMGDTMIIPLVEEVLKIEKQLILREEIHVTKIRSEERVQQPVTLRREEAHIERVDERGDAMPVEAAAVPRKAPVESVVREEPRPLREAPRLRKNKLIK